MTDAYLTLESAQSSLRRLPQYPVVAQSSHGFAVGALIRHNGSTWVTASASASNTLATHIVARVINANSFSPVAYDAALTVGAHGITPGGVVYLSNAGALSGTAGAIVQSVGRALNSTQILVNITDPAIQSQLYGMVIATYLDITDLPLVTRNSATQVIVSPGVAVVEHHLDPNDRRIWRLATGVGSQIAVNLPGGVSAGQTVYLWLGVNASDTATAFFDSSNVAANRPSGYDYVRLLTAIVLNGSAQIPAFEMDEERWIYSDFVAETFIAGASWASKVIPGCPLGKVEVFGISTSGLPVTSGTYSIRTSLSNPTTSAIAAPSGSPVETSAFNGNISAHYESTTNSVRAFATNFFGIATDRLLWHYKTTGSNYLGATHYPTVRLLKYRTVARQLT